MIWFYSHIYIILMSLLTAIYLDNHLQCLGSYGIFDFVTRFYPIDQIPGRFLFCFFSQRGRPRRNMRFNSKRRVNRRHLSTGNKIYCMFAIQFNEIRLVPLQSRRERRSLNTVKSLSDKKGILAHKMCRRVYNKIWGFLVQVAVFQYTHRDL